MFLSIILCQSNLFDTCSSQQTRFPVKCSSVAAFVHVHAAFAFTGCVVNRNNNSDRAKTARICLNLSATMHLKPQILLICITNLLPSVLWRCGLGGRKGIRPVKNWVVGVLAWFSVWSEVQTCIWPSRCHCHSLSLASVKSRLVYLSGTGSPG